MLHLRNCRFVVTHDLATGTIKVLEEVDIKVREDGVVEKIGKNLRTESGYEVVDCRRYVVIPGLVNAHTHVAMTLLRGFCDDEEVCTWLQHMWGVERELTPEVVRLASELGIMEMLSTGTTAFIDMYYMPEQTAEVAERYGIRAALGPVFMDVMYSAKKVENDLRNLVTMCRGMRYVRPIVNVHSIYTCTRETLERARDLASELNLNIQIHISETRHEVYRCRKETGKFPIEYIAELGLVTERTQLVHLGWVASWELGIIRDQGATVTHCPVSSMKLATAGFLPIKEMMSMGIRVTIGTDGAASNNTLDMFRELKAAVLLHRHGYWSTDINAQHVFTAATVRGYELLNIKGGVIAPGYVADLVLIDVEKAPLQPLRRDNVLSTLVYCVCGRDVEMTMVSGKVVYWRKRDEEKWRERAMEIANKLNKYMEKYLT
ncbi:MAG: amidohydrolase [Thermoprotei archaeon]|nr:MAG: amidohydrolase [Thermoprotei archaeon]RLE56717.1 MAG: amidohydrolase [Thermoprotei archaeon]